MKPGDEVIYTWFNCSYYGTQNGEFVHKRELKAEGKVLALKGKLSALVEFSRGGLRVAQLVRLDKLTLKQSASPGSDQPQRNAEE